MGCVIMEESSEGLMEEFVKAGSRGKPSGQEAKVGGEG